MELHRPWPSGRCLLQLLWQVSLYSLLTALLHHGSYFKMPQFLYPRALAHADFSPWNTHLTHLACLYLTYPSGISSGITSLASPTLWMHLYLRAPQYFVLKFLTLLFPELNTELRWGLCWYLLLNKEVAVMWMVTVVRRDSFSWLFSIMIKIIPGSLG